MPDICVVLNLHREGLLAHASLRSALEAKATAEAKGIAVEVVAVADRSDEATRRFLEVVRGSGARVHEVDYGDSGLSRNAAVESTHADFVAFLDADDLWAPNWLSAAFAAATADPREVVWHPEANLYFGPAGNAHWLQHPDMDDADFDWTGLALSNYWTALAFARRDLLLRIPYSPTNLDSGFGYEDWAWNTETIARGVIHKTVPGTVHLIRMRPQSLVRRTSAAGALMTPTSLFRTRLASRHG